MSEPEECGSNPRPLSCETSRFGGGEDLQPPRLLDMKRVLLKDLQGGHRAKLRGGVGQAYFSRGTLPKKRNGKRALLGDLVINGNSKQHAWSPAKRMPPFPAARGSFRHLW